MKLYQVLWPDRRMVTAEQLIAWAKDDYANNEGFDGELPSPVTVEDAIQILKYTGSVTLGNKTRDI